MGGRRRSSGGGIGRGGGKNSNDDIDRGGIRRNSNDDIDKREISGIIKNIPKINLTTDLTIAQYNLASSGINMRAEVVDAFFKPSEKSAFTIELFKPYFFGTDDDNRSKLSLAIFASKQKSNNFIHWEYVTNGNEGSTGGAMEPSNSNEGNAGGFSNSNQG